MSETLTLVDENDQPIMTGSREDAWQHGYYTRNVRIVVRDENGRILSQKRSMKKGTYPGMYTVAASGHVEKDEEWDEAAIRETKEEIGVLVSLNPMGAFNFQDDDNDKKIRQIIHVYEATIKSDTRITLDPNEVDEVKWFDLTTLKEYMMQRPSDFTPSFIETITRFY